jgi:uncharacterized protein YndB with AHSA1/START domain
MALRLNKSCNAFVVISAPIDAVWGLISDVTRTGEWSVECRGAEWLDGATTAVAGARFRGKNRRNATSWSRVCEVLEVDAPHRFVWKTLPTRLLPDSTRWEFALTTHDSGTKLTERMQVLKIPAAYDRLFAAFLPQHRDRTSDLAADLERIKQQVESPAGSAA